MDGELKEWSLKETVIVTDTGSTKGLIMKKAEELREKGITFIGGHPMAGSHKSGITAAKPYLFENAYYILTPFDDEDGNNLIALEQLLKYTLAKIVKMNAEEHDHMTAVVSHFPHIVAASLVHQLHEENKKYPMTSHACCGRFPRYYSYCLIESDNLAGYYIAKSQELIGQMDAWIEEMQRVKKILTRKMMMHPSKNILKWQKMFGMHCRFPQEHSILHTIYMWIFRTTLGSFRKSLVILAEEKISITNIRVVETREDVFGILVISFQNEKDREKAMNCIRSHTNFEMHVS